MKGLMVSLIIVLLAGSSTILTAGQQDAAGVESRLKLQPSVASPFDRPGPDESDDEVAWPTPTSVSRGSTNTSQTFGDRQLRAPAPESGLDKDIRFDVKVNQNAIEQLKQGRKVFSPVEVRDQTTNAALHPSVVSDIALFLDDNAGRQDLKGIRLDPQPMEPGSTTLTFEIPEQQLDRIEQDAFLFNVPDGLRGKFDRVEFVKGPAGSHELPTGLTGGPRGSGIGFGNPDSNNRFVTNQADRFKSPDETQRWNLNTPQPGPGALPGDRDFIGPVIDPVDLQANRDRMARLDQDSNFGRQGGQVRSPLDTGNRFKIAREPNDGLLSRPRETSDFNRNTIDQSQGALRQNTTPTSNDQRYQESIAQQQLRILQQQLADAEADKQALQKNASDWMREADTLAQQRNNLSQQLKSVSNRELAVLPATTQPAGFQPGSVANRTYLDRTIAAVKPFGSQREDFGYREPVYSNPTQTELAQQSRIDQLRNELEDQKDKNRWMLFETEERIADLKKNMQRRSTSEAGIQPTSYLPDRSNPVRSADRNNTFGQENPNLTNIANDPRGRGAPGKNPPEYRQTGDNTDGQELNTNKKSSSDLIWLLPLLLGSLGLNFYLWVHCRTLYMRYTDLADELRGMVGASTI